MERSSPRELASDSPSLWGSLQRRILDSDRAQLAEIYSLACAYGALSEGGVRREGGASFNPRPARICQILINECNESDPDVFAAAMLACCTSQPDFQVASPAAVGWGVASRVIRVQSGLEIQFDETVARVLLALQLDELRHLHMTELSCVERQLLCGRVANLLPQIEESSSNRRLKMLVVAAIDRFERRSAY